MDNPPDPDLAEEFAAALEWWREAGVDCTYHETPARWTAAPDLAEKRVARAGESRAERAERAPPPQPERPAVDRSAWPQDIDTFEQWWLAEPWLDDGRVAGRVPPRGPKGAELMVVVPEPEREDRERLLSGPQGKLLDAMLASMGLSPARTYVASALPRHTPVADWQALAERGIGDVLRHHIKIVGPQRLVVFGGNILPLAGNDLPNSAEPLRGFNHEGFSSPMLAATDLAVLLARPRAKARLWQLWLDWTGAGTE